MVGRLRPRVFEGGGDPGRQRLSPLGVTHRLRDASHLIKALRYRPLRFDDQQPHPRPPQRPQGGRRGVAADGHKIGLERQQPLRIVPGGGIATGLVARDAGHLGFAGEGAETRDLIRVRDAQKDRVNAGEQGDDPAWRRRYRRSVSGQGRQRPAQNHTAPEDPQYRALTPTIAVRPTDPNPDAVS